MMHSKSGLRGPKSICPQNTWVHPSFKPLPLECYCMCESQHLQAQRIQRLNSKFILVRIRNTDHVLRVRWDQSPLTENMAIMACCDLKRRRRRRRVMSGRNGVLQCSVSKTSGQQCQNTMWASARYEVRIDRKTCHLWQLAMATPRRQAVYHHPDFYVRVQVIKSAPSLNLILTSDH